MFRNRFKSQSASTSGSAGFTSYFVVLFLQAILRFFGIKLTTDMVPICFATFWLLNLYCRKRMLINCLKQRRTLGSHETKKPSWTRIWEFYIHLLIRTRQVSLREKNLWRYTNPKRKSRFHESQNLGNFERSISMKER